MPNINRIRVNNVKYNFGTQSYDDFIMKMYGRNTLYDLANGGGKSVLMLLLMQCVIPNSTLDDKQPIEKLFRGNENTCIHSLVEWKLDDCDITEGMRYMTTGFAAKKAGGGSSDQQTIEGIEVQEAGADEDKTTAEIEYFNYCIFYRDYNKNDIVNLPLVKGEERISYKGLRNYLLDLARTDKNIIVKVFDRKGEYQRFIAEYGLYESQWELIRGINRTEGHVRTYFETNFRTTRKIIEDQFSELKQYIVYAIDPMSEFSGNEGSDQLTVRMRKIWGRVLDKEVCDVNDNLFDIGGNSLAVFKLVSMIKDELGIELRPVDIMTYSSIKSLTGYIMSNFITFNNATEEKKEPVRKRALKRGNK